MLENTERNSRDFSVYDKMSAEDLEMLLLADIDSDDQVTDMEVLCYVMELITKREKESGIPRKTTQDAYAEFREKYMYSEDLAYAEDIDNPSESVEVSVPKAPSRVIPFMKRLPRVAVITIVSLGVAMALAMSVEAIRKPVIDFIFKHFSNHSTIVFSDEYTEPQEDDIYTAIENVPIPDGYELANETINEDWMITLLYINQSDDRIRLIITSADGAIDFDSEGFKRQETTINGSQGVFFSKDQEMQMIWLDESSSLSFFLYSSNLDEINFWEIANYWSNIHIKF